MYFCKMKQKIFTAILILSVLLPVEARTIRDFLASEPDDVLLLVPQSVRLDMMDYYDSGQTPSLSSRLGNDARMLVMDSAYVKLQTSEVRTVEMLMLQYSRRDTILAVIETVKTPVPDSRLRFFNSNWVELTSLAPLKKMPTLEDFFLSSVKKDKRQELLSRLPFTMIELTFEGESHDRLVVRHGLAQFLSKDEYKLFAPYVRSTVTYQISGAKFKRVD